MKQVLISLVGDQTVPNVLLIKDPAFAGVEEYLFLITELMEARQRLLHILSATAIPAGRCRSLRVPADDLSGIRAALDQWQLPSEGVHYLVNLTSGTKLMSIALFDYFSQPPYRACSTVFYVPIGQNAFIEVGRQHRGRVRPLSYRISLPEYLACYGVGMGSAAEADGLFPAAFTGQWAQQMGQAGRRPDFAKAMHGLRQSYNRNRGKGAAMALQPAPALKEALAGLGFPLPADGRLGQRAARYLTGGWLEEWVFHRVKALLGLEGRYIACSVRLEWQPPGGARGQNEFDLLFTHDNTLHVLECKTGFGKRPGAVFEDAVYKLAALRRELGIRVPAGLLSFQPLRPSQSRKYRQRAALHQLALMEGEAVNEQLRSWLLG